MHFNLLIITNNNKKKKQHYSIDFNIATINSVRKNGGWIFRSREEWLWRESRKKCFIVVSSTALCTENLRRHLDRLPSSLRTCCRLHALCVIIEIIYGDFFILFSSRLLLLLYRFTTVSDIIINNTRTNHIIIEDSAFSPHK